MKNILVVIVVFALLGIGAYVVVYKPVTVDVPDTARMSYAASSAPEASVQFAPPTADYTNERYKFSLKRPEGFVVTEIPDEEAGTLTLVLQNDQGEGVQILITPSVGDMRSLTEEMVRADIPNMQLSDIQRVDIGEGHTGIAFLSDNEAFGGASREVWFIFRGNLYQVSTYARLDALLQSMFSTWQFL